MASGVAMSTLTRQPPGARGIDRIAEMNRRGVTFLIIEHNMDLVARLCGRVFVMAAGQLLFEGTPAAVMREPAVIEAYLGGSPQ